jgi:HK97 family phage portal protein
MGFIQEFRTGSLENPQTPLSYPAEWLADIYNGGRTDAGLRVSQMTAIQVPTVYSCVMLIAQAIAALPWNVVEISRTAEGRTKRLVAYDHDLHDLLHTRPHPEMSSYSLRIVMLVSLLLWGNLYVEIIRDGLGNVVGLTPRSPWKTGARRLLNPSVIQGEELQRGQLIYVTTQGVSDGELGPDNGEVNAKSERGILPENMIYVPGLTIDGRVGQDTIWLARQAVGLALATEKFGAKFFGNGGHPSGVLEIVGNQTKEQLERARASFQEATGGENMHRIFVVNGQTKFTPLATPNDNAQFLQTREAQVREIARVFRVPLQMLAEPGTNRATAEQIGIEFLRDTISPWIAAIEQEVNYKLFPKLGRNSGRFQSKFDTHRLVYPDAASRDAFYQHGKLSGWLSTNDIHELEGLNPVSDENGGEDYWQPVNMVVIGEKPEPEPQPVAPQAPPPNTPPENQTETKSLPDFSDLISAQLPAMRDALGRLSARKKVDTEHFIEAILPVLQGTRDGIASYAARQFGIPAPDLGMDKLLRDLASGMHKRNVTEPLPELQKATRVIAGDVYKEFIRKGMEL